MAQPSEYLRTKVMTASPPELQLLLYDGAIRFSWQARQQMQVGDNEQAYHPLVRSQQIILQMASGLNHEVNPEICGRPSSLYNFIYRKLIEANMFRRTEPIDEALKLLDYERETWAMLLEGVRKESADLSQSEETPTTSQAEPSQPQAPSNPVKATSGYAAVQETLRLSIRG